MSIDDAPASQYMDALIAKRVMGLSLVHLPARYIEIVTPDGSDGTDGMYCPRCGASESEYDRPCAKRYSADIATAWEVVEKLHSNGLSVQCGYSLYGGIPFAGAFGTFEYGDTVALAICKLALSCSHTV